MLKLPARLFSLCALVLGTATANAQFYKLHNADLGINGVGTFTRTLTSNSTNTQDTTDTVGLVLSLREHPFSWAGIEVNYGYNKYGQRYLYNGGRAQVRTKSYNHEATAAYVFHPHFRNLQPFINVGGGAIDFVPQTGLPAGGDNQWRGVGLVETGLDLPTRNPHLGFRFQGRGLVYRAPNFNSTLISSRSWVITIEPSGGVYFRF